MNEKREHTSRWFLETFGALPEIVAWAPGRLELLGNHTDYNLGEVLGLTVDRGIRVSIRRREGGRECRLESATPGMAPVRIALDGKPMNRRAGKNEAWVNYVLGVWQELRAEGLGELPGFDLGVESTLPAGAGMSSSAALEVATALALYALGGKAPPDQRQLARLCRRAENDFVGMPCGILDQGVVVYGDRNRVVCIDCKTEAIEALPLPAGLRFWVFNTAEKHALVDSLYAERHRECLQARDAMRTALPGLEGLADLSPEALSTHAGLLSETLRKRARHVVYENARVKRARRLLQSGVEDGRELGQLLLASHASSRTDFENSTDHLDFVVDHLRDCPALLGARLTGGGFGGAVLALAGSDFTAESAASVARAYNAEFGLPLTSFAVETGAGPRVSAASTS